ncbi:MAG: RloB domain-containing protein, partial [Phaeodactylibacter sp.]|nr:RloB domain-containing protein [Phaeodactylibacter sp.]
MARKGKIKRDRKTIEEVVRPVRWRKYQQICLIVCEDTKTEPAYFNTFSGAFPEESFYIRCVGAGKDSLGVVEQALQEVEALKAEAKKDIDFVWVVFDKDDADKKEVITQRFDKAFALAAEAKMEVAFSNEVFELWLLLHFQHVPTDKPMPRKDIYDQLEKAIQGAENDSTYSYTHGDDAVIAKVSALGDENHAITRAKVLDKKFKGVAPIKANPSTQVYRLVEELREWIAYHNWEPEGK